MIHFTGYWLFDCISVARGDQPTRVGMEGAAGPTTADDASTAGSTATEERSEAPESSQRGLPACQRGAYEDQAATTHRLEG
jgi:hypothetical protein